MIITRIEPVSAKKSRIILEEEGISFILYQGEIRRFRLEEGGELTDALFRTIRDEILIKRAKLRALSLLSRRDYTEAELRDRLAQGEYTKEAEEAAVACAASFHYLDDSRYLERYVARHQGSRSRAQMENELVRRGIGRDEIRACFEELEEDESGAILSQLRKRRPDPEADRREREKQFAYFARKGYRGSDIKRAFETYFQDRER